MYNKLSWLLFGLWACSASSPEPLRPVSVTEAPPQVLTEEAAAPLRYVYATKQSHIYRPRGAGAFGMAMAGARLPVFAEEKGPGCKGLWLQIQLESWICSEVTQDAPFGEESESHPENASPHQRAVSTRSTTVYTTPGGEKVKELPSGSQVRVFRIVEFEGGSYAQISSFGWVDAEALDYKGHRSWSTHWQGFETPPEIKFPIVIFKDAEIPVFEKPGITDPKQAISKKHRYQYEPVLETKTIGNKQFGRVSGGWFLVQEGAVLVAPEPRPADVPEGIHWVLVDLSDQTLVAYDNDKIVWVTLVASGKRNPTVVGNFGITRKYRYSTMAGEMFGEKYRVDDVPWPQYFYKGYAIHGAFWHDKFGYRASHGCVNVAPADAMWLAEFLQPVLPQGWLLLYPSDDMPTSRVVVRY